MRPVEPSRAIDKPEPGYFWMRLVRGGPKVAARIKVESGLWSAEIDGAACGAPNADPFLADGVSRIWEGGRRIAREEFEYLLAVKAYAMTHAKDHPAAHPEKAVDLRTLPADFIF